MMYTLPLTLLALESESYHLTLESRFEDGSLHIWILDTGASKTVFDESLLPYFEPGDPAAGETIQSAGIGAHQLNASLGRLKPFSLGALYIEALPVALIDLRHINDLYWKVAGKHLCGLIGSDFLLRYKAVIDYGKMELLLEVADL